MERLCTHFNNAIIVQNFFWKNFLNQVENHRKNGIGILANLIFLICKWHYLLDHSGVYRMREAEGCSSSSEEYQHQHLEEERNN